MEWEKKIPSRLNRRSIPKSSHLTGQVGQAGLTGLTGLTRFFSPSARGPFGRKTEGRWKIAPLWRGTIDRMIHILWSVTFFLWALQKTADLRPWAFSSLTYIILILMILPALWNLFLPLLHWGPIFFKDENMHSCTSGLNMADPRSPWIILSMILIWFKTPMWQHLILRYSAHKWFEAS